MSLSTQLCLISAASLFFLTTADAIGSQIPMVSIEPSDLAISQGGTKALDINIFNAADLYAFQFDISFGGSNVLILSEIDGDLLARGGNTFFVPGTVGPAGTTIAATADTLLGGVAGVTGSGTLAAITVMGLHAGTIPVELENVILLDSNLNSLAYVTDNGSITVEPATAPSPEPRYLAVLGSCLILALRRKLGHRVFSRQMIYLESILPVRSLRSPFPGKTLDLHQR